MVEPVLECPRKLVITPRNTPFVSRLYPIWWLMGFIWGLSGVDSPSSVLMGLNENGTPICFWYPLKFNSSNLKMDGRKTIFFLLGWPIFKGYVSFREGMGLSYLLRFVRCLDAMFLGSSHTEPQFRWPWMSRVSFGRARCKWIICTINYTSTFKGVPNSSFTIP